jgi:hypothetical protein
MTFETKFSLNQIVYVISKNAGAWQVTYSKAKIGKIGIEAYSTDYTASGYDNRVYYMTNKTGVGSGLVLQESNIFETYEDAMLECEKRNSLMLKR